MGQILSDLSYSNEKALPIGHPTDDLKALYKEKEKDYNYVLDTFNTAETVLNKIKGINNNDNKIVENAKIVLKNTFDSFGEDLENKKIDTKKLAHDLTNKYGLSEVQKVAKQQQQYESNLKNKFDKGDITREMYNRYIKDARDNYKGIQQDKETGLFSGNYNGRVVSDYIDVQKEVADAIKGIKSNTSELPYEYTKDGYIKRGTQESVTEEEVIKAATSFITGNDKIQEQFNEDLYFETKNKNINADSIKSILNKGLSNNLKQQLGIFSYDNIDNIDKLINEGVYTPEQLYSIIRKDQMSADAMAATVEKESFIKDKFTFQKNWKQERYLKNLDKKKDKEKVKKESDKGLMTVHRLATVQKISPTDFNNIRKGKKATTELLKNNKLELQRLKKQQQEKGNVDLNSIKNLKIQINQNNRNLEDFERQENSIFNFVNDKSNINFKNEYDKYLKERQEKIRLTVSMENSLQHRHSEFGSTVNNEKEIETILKTTKENAEKEYELISFKDFKNEIIKKYSTGDTNFKLLKATNDSFLNIYTRRIASNIKDNIGKLEHLPLTQDLTTFITDNISSSNNSKYKEYVNVMQQILINDSNSFTFKGKNLDTIIEEELDVDVEDIDKSKLKIHPSIEYVDGKPAYAISVFGNKEDNKNPLLGKVLVNYEGSPVGHDELIQDISIKQSKQYKNKIESNSLQGNDLTVFRKLSKSYINSSFAGKELDRLNIYTAETNLPLNWRLNSTHSINIVPKVSNSKNDFGTNNYYLQNNNGQYLGINSNGEEMWGTEEELFEIHSFSGADELKEVVGSILLKNRILE